MSFFPDGLTNEEYALLRSLHVNDAKHFNREVADTLMKKGLAVITDAGHLQATETGLAVPRTLRVQK
ncbi:hypothetical protein [Pseudogemmobacter sonorensis]|uniref:hypothetical protein n=1 Tax=Pseudogemmobacter sonorensis TaxID=2989681 RepID=UPI00368D6E34